MSSDLSFDPSLLPEPALLNAMRDNNRPAGAPVRHNEWYTPSIMFGTPGTPLPVPNPAVPETAFLRVGSMPIIYDCIPIGWYLSSIQPGFLELGLSVLPQPLGFADADPEQLVVDLSDDGAFFPMLDNLPTLLGTRRRVYEEAPRISYWPETFTRYSEIQVNIISNTICDQVLLVLFLLKMRLR